MARRGRKSKRGTTHSTSILTALFALSVPAYVLGIQPPGQGRNVLGNIMAGDLPNTAISLGQAIQQNWVSILLLLLIVFVGIKVVHKLGRGARITRHLRL